MNARKLMTTLALLGATGAALAADPTNTTPVPATNATAATAAAQPASQAPNQPALVLARADSANNNSGAVAPPARTAGAVTGRSRAEVRAEAVEAVRHHQSTLAESLELSRN